MRRQEKVLSLSLDHSLNLYALAASAAGVGLLALAPPAAAKVIYTPAHVRLLNSSTYLVLNPEGVPDFAIKNSYYVEQSYSQGYLGVNGVGSQMLVETSGSSSGFTNAAALQPGTKIPPTNGFHAFKKGGQLLRIKWNAIGGTQIHGEWLNAKGLYLGLKFRIGGKTHYGWARISATNDEYWKHCAAVLTGYAYETAPNKPIIAGKTKGPDVIILETSTLGHLARGASAISLSRNNAESTPNSGANQ